MSIRRSNVVVAGVLLSLMLLLHPTARAVEKPMISLIKTKTPHDEDGQVVLTNRLQEPLEFDRRPGLHLIPIVRNEAGEVVAADKPFGWLLSGDMPEKISIAPGSSYDCGVVGVLDLVPDEKRKPGKYHVRIRFEYKGTAWESNEIEIEHK